MKILEKSVIILSRVSTQMQDLEQQTESVKRLVKLDGYKDNHIITIEDKESAVLLSEEERNGLTEMKSIILDNPGKIEVVYAYEISRISRRTEVNFSIRNFLRDNHVQLKIVTPAITVFDKDWNISPEANVMYSLFTALAENEGYIRKARLERGRKLARKQGRFTGGNLLLGYMVSSKDRKIVVDPVTSKTVKRIFNDFLNEGLSVSKISDNLYNEGILTSRNNRINRISYIGGILRNKSYTGVCPEGGFQYPKIISEEMHKLACKKLDESKSQPRENYNSDSYYAQGIIRDKETGRKLLMKKNKHAYREFNDEYCIDMNVVDSLLLYCCDYSLKNHSSSDYEELQTKVKYDIDACVRRLRNYKKRLDDYQTKMDKLEERIIFGQISDDKSNEIRKKLNLEKREIISEQNKDNDILIRLKNNLEQLNKDSLDNSYIDVYKESDKRRKELIHKEIEFAEVYKKETAHYLVNIKYRNPMLDGQIFDLYTKRRTNKIVLYGENLDIKIEKRH